MIKGNFDIPLDFFSTATPAMFGVDISTSAIKMVELTQIAKRNEFQIERYVIEPLPQDAVVDGNINNLDAVSDALQRACERFGSRLKTVSLALPAATVITKRIMLPSGLLEDELEYQVESEASQYIPFALDEVNLDFHVIGPSLSVSGEIEVLLAASRKANVEDRVAAAQFAGLKAVVVDVEPYAEEAAFDLIRGQLPELTADQCVALIDIGANVMNLNILRDGQSVYTRDQPIGGAVLTQQIQHFYGLTWAEAEAAKLNGGLPEGYQREVLQPFLENVAGEVTRALQFFFSSTQQFTEVSYVVLAGGCAVLAGLDEAVAERTQVNTLVANPFAQMKLASRVKLGQLQLDAPALMIACGLALRRFDPA
jgi:type IV pilus assembly protein PilM